MRLCTRKLFCIVAAFFGGFAFISYAAAAHRNGFYQNLAPVFLGHSLILFILTFAPLKTTCYSAKLSGYLMILGVVLFSGDLLSREWLQTRLFPYAAPMGGILMIIGWFNLAFLAFSLKNLAFTKNEL